MTEYRLYLESGPQHRKTMVHVLDLLGCIANGPTTEAALAATPGAIEAFRRFFARHGEPFDEGGAFATRVEEHITQGTWLGNGSPYLMFGPDFEPVSADEMERFARRFEAMRAALAAWTDGQSEEDLDVAPATKGRTARSILLHVLGAAPNYASPMVGGMPGTSRIHTLCERGEMPLAEGLRQSGAILAERLRDATHEQRQAVFERGQITRSMRKAVRRTLEHEWEHLAELARRPGGPTL